MRDMHRNQLFFSGATVYDAPPPDTLLVYLVGGWYTRWDAIVPKPTLTVGPPMNELWQRITTWFANNVPPDLFSLAEGANEAEIKATESILGLRLPDDVRESYLLHNGSNEWAIFENQGLLSLDELIRK